MPLFRPLIACVLLGALSLAAVSFAARATEASPSAKALAEIVATGFRHGALPSMEQRGASDASVRCMRGLTGTDFTPTLQAMLDASLTPAEVATVDAYVSSDIGRRELEVILADMRQKAGEDSPDVPALTDAETRQVMAFQESAVARKLMSALESSMEAPDTPGSVGARMLALMAECGVF